MIVVENNEALQGHEAETMVAHLRMDRCPDCLCYGLQPGFRTSSAQILACRGCGARFNVAPPRYVMFAHRIG